MPEQSTIPYVYVYFLLNPETLVPFYVGQTKDPDTRIKRHRDQKRDPFIFEPISIVTLEQADEEERFWIAALRERGYTLQNKTSGGQRSYTPSEEVRAKISAKIMVIAASLEWRQKIRERNRGVPFTPERCQNISAALRRYHAAHPKPRKSKPELRGRQPMTEEQHARRSASSKAYMASLPTLPPRLIDLMPKPTPPAPTPVREVRTDRGFYAHSHTEEARAKISATMKGVPKSAETRERMRIAQQNRYRSPEERAHLSESARKSNLGRVAWNKGIPCTPEMRTRISATLKERNSTHQLALFAMPGKKSS